MALVTMKTGAAPVNNPVDRGSVWSAGARVSFPTRPLWNLSSLRARNHEEARDG